MAVEMQNNVCLSLGGDLSEGGLVGEDGWMSG